MKIPDLSAPILVLDFGGQYSQLIARRLREYGVLSELLPHDVPLDYIHSRKPAGLILSGGPASVYEKNAPPLRTELLEAGIPVLGICYGMQAMARALGGTVKDAGKGEFGSTAIKVISQGTLMSGLPKRQICWMSHRDSVHDLPSEFLRVAESSASPIAAFENSERGLYGIQFHPEVGHTEFGKDILTAFLRDGCGCAMDWTPTSIIPEQIEKIRKQVGNGRAICGLSGGVDSAVAALLTYRAIGDRLTCIFVDHGLMRSKEGHEVAAAFRESMNMPLVSVNAEAHFLKHLRGVVDPEKKRKIIGTEFIRVFEKEAAKLDDPKFLVQGTLYSDVVESGANNGSAKIKSHHNVGGLPAKFKFELVEPLRSLFKDEVRRVGLELGLPKEIVRRQPFPGPGLAIRIVGGDVTRKRLDILRRADQIFQEEVRKAGLYDKLWQSFCVLPAELRSVGVQGDSRSYGHVVVLRVVTSEDAMTADWEYLPRQLINTISSRLISDIPDINRVTLDVTSKPPGTIEWE